MKLERIGVGFKLRDVGFRFSTQPTYWFADNLMLEIFSRKV
jgi:hypothetical protein